MGCPEMSVTDYQSTLHNIPEERRSHLHRDGSLKLQIRINFQRVDIFIFSLQMEGKRTKLISRSRRL
jgi:hypothetical protein